MTFKYALLEKCVYNIIGVVVVLVLMSLVWTGWGQLMELYFECDVDYY